MDECPASDSIEQLRVQVGDFGVSLFAPLFHLDCSSCAPNEVLTEESESSGEEDEHRPLHLVLDDPVVLQCCPYVLSPRQMDSLRGFLPRSLQDNAWERIFAIGKDGDSFCTLLQKCASFRCTVVAIRSTSGDILGGFASDAWNVGKHRQSYYGCGQSFLFASNPDDGREHRNTDALQIFQWTGDNDYCQICDRTRMCMGGVGEFGWIVSDDFTKCQTGVCRTFGNPPLSREKTFAIADFEIYGLSCPFWRHGSSVSLNEL